MLDDGELGGKFRQFPLSPPVLKAIHDMGWREPSEIQSLVIPLALTGRDVVGQAKTGTGKTGAFAIPCVERFRAREAAGQRGRSPVVLVLAPTRELAVQVHDQFDHLSGHARMRSVAIYGGAPMEPQLRALREGADVVVGTPGRVMDHVRRGTLRLDAIQCLVLDEADRMFDLGFRDDIYWISRRLPSEGRQTLLLSATIAGEVLKLAQEVTSDPELVYTAPEGTDLTVNTVEQFYVAVDPERKLDLLVRLIEDEAPEKGMVFTRTKRGADKVAEKLRQRGQDAGEIHGDLKQKRREQILESFREGGLHLMVCTDVAARGLDIQGVTHIFNFDVPENPEDYVHRVGRTARMGKRGRAFTFVTREDGDAVTPIEKLINKEIPRFAIDGFRAQANEDERAASTVGRAAGLADHPLAKKLSPALLAILNERRGRGGPTRGGPRPGGGGGGRDRACGGGGGGRDRGRGGRR
ncbi:MAG: DEAD/DEAH box helicase [Planctomycetes bacterium]|nr:DEAD/DEAH box helicase [Planctomycetota bacterium]